MSWRILTLIGAVAAGLSCTLCVSAGAPATGTLPASNTPEAVALKVTRISITNGKIGPGANETPAETSPAAAGGTTDAAGTTGGTTAGTATQATTPVTVQVGAAASTITQAAAVISKATASQKSPNPTLTAECRVWGTITAKSTSNPIVLTLLVDSITPELLDSIKVTAFSDGHAIRVRCAATSDKTTVNLTRLDANDQTNWKDCVIKYAFATTPWSVAKYELWPKAPGGSGMGLAPYQARAWLAFSFSPSASSANSKTPPTPSEGAAAPTAGAQLSGTAKASNLGTLLGTGVVYATGNSAAPQKNPPSPPKPGLSEIMSVTLFDKDTKFVTCGGLQAGGNYMLQDCDCAGWLAVQLAKCRVVHLPPSSDWPKLGVQRKSLSVTEDYLIVNSPTNQAMPGAPIEIYDDYPIKGTPKFAGKIGRLAKNEDEGQLPIRLNRSPVVAPFAQLVRVRSVLLPVQAKITVEDQWTHFATFWEWLTRLVQAEITVADQWTSLPSPAPQRQFLSSRVNTVTFTVGGDRTGIFPDTADDLRTSSLFLPSAALPNVRPPFDSLIVSAQPATCEIRQTIESENIDAQFADSLTSINQQLQETSKRIAKLQDELQRLKVRHAAIQEAAGDVGQAELYEIQTQIRGVSDQLADVERKHAAAEFQISRIVGDSEKNAGGQGSSETATR